MKTRHIIGIGLLTALAVSILGLAIYTNKNPAKTQQTKAEDNTQLTDVTDTTWLFNETILKEDYWHVFNINFTSNNTHYTKLIFQNDNYNENTQNIYYTTPWTEVYYDQEWISTTYRTIEIHNGADVTNTQFIDILYTYATLQYDPYEAGYTAGYNTGYAIGYNDSDAFNHPIDLAGTMLNVLTMPFTFISQAFDVTLWPGTQYQINIGNFIKAMIAISAILFIIKLFTSGFSIIGNYTNNINREAKIRSDNRKSKLAWKSQKITEKGANNANKD